jgi:uncharacterized protein with HEPN domain
MKNSLKQQFLNENEYNLILDALDIFKIKEIIEIETFGTKEFNTKFSFSLKNGVASTTLFNMQKLFTTINSKPILQKTSVKNNDTQKEYREEITYDCIIDSVKSLGTHSGSIKETFDKVFPWDNLEIIEESRNSTDKRQEITKQFNKDLPEVKERLKEFVKFRIKEKSKLEGLLGKEVVDFFTDEQIKDISKPENSDKIDGFVNIRKITQPILDKIRQDKILKLIEEAEKCNPEEVEGKFAFLAISWIIGENAKRISDGTKASNTEIPFQALKKFRDNQHDFSKIKGSKILLKNINNKASNKDFKSIQTYFVDTLYKLIKNLKISDDITAVFNPQKIKKYKLNKEINENQQKEFLEIVKLAIPDNLLDTEKVQNILNDFQLILAAKIPTEYVGNINLMEYFQVKLSESVILHTENLSVYLKDVNGKEKDKSKKKKQKKQIDNLKKFKIIEENDSNDSEKIDCLDKILPKYDKGKSSNETKSEILIENRLDLLLKSLEWIKENTDSKLKTYNNDFQLAREKSANDPQFYYSHLCNLIIIGECRKNLLEQKLFQENASLSLINELEFLRWIRNSLLHDQELKETGSTFELFINDLMTKNKIIHSGSSAYDSREFYDYLKSEVNTLLKNIQNNMVNFNWEETQEKFYTKQLLQELSIAYKYSNKDSQVLLMEKLYTYKIVNKNEIEDFRDGLNESIIRKVLSNKFYLSLNEVYKNYDKIQEIAKNYDIELISVLGESLSLNCILNTENDLEIIFVVKNSSRQNLVLFKQSIINLLHYKLRIVSEKDCEEYLKTQFPKEWKKNLESLQIFCKQNSFDKIINSIGLHLTIDDNHATIEDIDKLLKNCSIDFQYEAITLIYRAFNSNKKEILNKLIEAGADVNIIVGDDGEQTLLHRALDRLFDSTKEEYDIAKSFILNTKKLKLIQEPTWKTNPLHILAYNFNKLYSSKGNVVYIKIIKTLLDNASVEELNQVDGYGKTPLLEAIEGGNLEIANMLASTPSTDINIAKVESMRPCVPYIPIGCSPITIAILLGYNELVETLLKRNEIKTANDSFINLYVGSKDNVKYIEHPKFPPKNSAYYEFPEDSSIIHFASATGNIKLLKIFLSQFGSKLLFQNDICGHSPLCVATKYKQEAVIELFNDKEQLNQLFSTNLDETLYTQFLDLTNPIDRVDKLIAKSIMENFSTLEIIYPNVKVDINMQEISEADLLTYYKNRKLLENTLKYEINDTTFSFYFRCDSSLICNEILDASIVHTKKLIEKRISDELKKYNMSKHCNDLNVEISTKGITNEDLKQYCKSQLFIDLDEDNLKNDIKELGSNSEEYSQE